MDNKELAKQLLEACGGASNIVTAENCMTRLRVILVDDKKADFEKIKATEDVLGLVGESKDIQIVIGPGKVAKVTNFFLEEVSALGGTAAGRDGSANTSDKKEQRKPSSGVQSALKKLSQIFVPLIPGIMAAGLLLGITSILNICITQGWLPESQILTTIITLFTIIANGCLSFLCIFVGINSAKVFKCSAILGGLIGGIVLLESVNDLSMLINDLLLPLFNGQSVYYDSETVANSLLCTGKGGVIGVIAGVWLLSKIENWLHKHVPDNLDLVIVPLVSALCAGTVMLLVIMPAAGLLSTGIVTGLEFLGNSEFIIVKIIYGFVLGATFLPIVMLGLHQSLVPIYFLQLDQVGYISMIAAQMMAGGANIGAAIAVYFKAKSVGHKSLQKIIAGSVPTAILGIHEPLIYGMTLPIAILFVPIGIGAGIGGIWCVLTNTLASSYGPATLLGVTTMQPTSMLNYLIGLVISCVAAAIFTQFMIPKSRIKKHMEDTQGGAGSSGADDFNALIRS